MLRLRGSDAVRRRLHWRGKLRNAFGYRRDITLKACADSAKNTKSNVTLPALHASQITPVQTALRCEDLLAIAQYLPCSADSVTEF